MFSSVFESWILHNFIFCFLPCKHVFAVLQNTDSPVFEGDWEIVSRRKCENNQSFLKHNTCFIVGFGPFGYVHNTIQDDEYNVIID